MPNNFISTLPALVILQLVQSSGSQPDGECQRPTAVLNGEKVSIEDTFSKKRCGSSSNARDCFVLVESKPVLYVPDFLNSSVVEQLQSLCGPRFQRSPIRGTGGQDGTSVQANKVRTSESCAMVPAAQYLENPRFHEIKEAGTMPEMVREVYLTWSVSKQAASLVDVSPRAVEPLQMVRYLGPTQEYQVHHDHGGFYGKTTELRPWTVLVFLKSPLSGGFTTFPKLGLKVYPRAGDALVWSNTDRATGTADPDMVHAGEPPTEGEKYALNIWIAAGDDAMLEGGLWGSDV